MTKKINEVTKVATMSSTETVPIVMSDGSVGQIPLSSLSTAMADIMRTQTIDKNGLMPSGFRSSLSTSDKETTKFIIGYKSRTHYCTFLAAGHYSNPAIYILNLGMYGGNPSGHPYSLKITKLSGPASSGGSALITSGKAFVRGNKNCIELTFSSSIRYTTVSAIDFKAGIEFMSTDEAKMYNESTDTLMRNATVE